MPSPDDASGSPDPASPRGGQGRPRILRGLLLTVGGAFFAAVYLLPYKAATRLAPAEQVVLPMLLVAAALSSLPLLLGRAGPRLLPDETAARRQGRRGLGLSLWVAALLGALSALGNESVARALANIAPGITAVVLRTQVVFVALAARVVLGERVSARFWVGASLALGGMAMLRFSGEAPVVTLWGMTWALVAAASFGAMQVVVRHSIQDIDTMLINALRLWLASALIALLPGRAAGLMTADASLWALTAAAAVAGPIISRLLLMAALRHIPAAMSSLALFSQPVFAYLLAAPLFGVLPGALEVAGCSVVLCGIALPVMEHLKRPEPDCR